MLPEKDLNQPPKNQAAIEQQLDNAQRAKKKPKPQPVNLQTFQRNTASMSSAAFYGAKSAQQKPPVVEEKGGVKDDFPALGGAVSTPIIAPKQPQIQPQPLPQPSLRKPKRNPLDDVKRRFGNWDQKDHGGCRALGLSEEQIDELMEWAGSLTTLSGANAKFEVIRGPGTGDWAGADQVKLVSWYGGKKSGKKVTFHITVRK